MLRGHVLLAALGLLLWGAPEPAWAASGSGSATLLQPNSAVAGSRHGWTILYDPAEDFANPSGGVLEILIPAGWSAPQRTNSGLPGYVDVTNQQVVTSLTISGQTIHLVLGGGPPATKKFLSNDFISLLYGVGGPNALPFTQTSAPAAAHFFVSSDPQNSGVVDTLSAGSPFVTVLPDTVASVQIVNPALVAVDALARTTDQDTTHLYLRGYDQFGNSARWVRAASWTVSGGIGSAVPDTGLSTILSLAAAGSGKVYADSGAWRDSTGVVTVSHGAYASLEVTSPAGAVAGAPFSASVEARDADGNRVDSGAGSNAAVRFIAYADSLGPLTANASFVDPNATLSAGYWSGSQTARRAGVFFLAARDTVTGLESSPRRRLLVTHGPPDQIALRPDTLRLVAGDPETLTVVVRDALGNRASVSANEELTLWTDRPQGRFEDLAGSTVFTLTIPVGSDSADVRYRDFGSTTTPGRVRAIDANGTAPFLGTAASPVFTEPNVPVGSFALAGAPDTLVANGADSSRITSGVIRDAYGNAVPAGERFMISAVGLTPVTDDDPGAPGAQWIAAAGGTISGWVRAGTVTGSASIAAISERGSASGSASLTLRAGLPAGPIALAAQPDSLAADSLSTRTITATSLVDPNGNPVEEGEPYTVSTTLGTITTADQDPGTPGLQVLASTASISFDLFGGDQLGVAAVSAASVRGVASGGVNVRLVPGAVSADRSSAAVSSPAVVGSPGGTLTVLLRDRQDHPLPSVPVDSIDVTGSPLDPTITPLSSQTDAGGSIQYSVAATATGTSALSVTARGVTLTDAPVIAFTHGPLDTLVVSGPAGPLTAGVSDSLVVEAKDSFGNAMPDRSDLIHVAVTTGAASGWPGTAVLSGGRATIPFTPTSAVPLTIQIADDSSHATPYGPVAVNAGPAYRVVADPPARDTLLAGDSIAVRARVYDVETNPVPAASVTSLILAGGGSVSPGAASTNALGFADFMLRAGSVPGTILLRLESGSAADSVTVTVLPGAAVSAEIAAASDTVRAGDPLDVNVTLRDSFGNVATGATGSIWLRTTSSLRDSISWSLGSGASGSLADSASGDGALYTFAAADGGRAPLRLRGTRAETIRLRVSGPGVPLAESPDVTITAAAASSLAIGSGNGQTAVVAHELPAPLRVLMRDGFGNPTPGASVVFRVAAGTGSIDAVRGGALDSVATADAAGIASCDVVRLGTLAGAGSDVVRAGLPGPPFAEVFFTANATADAATSLTLSPPALNLPAASTAIVAIQARDTFGNAAPGTDVTTYLGSPPAGTLESTGQTSGSGTTQSGTTDSAGQLAVRYRAPSSAPAADSIFARGVSIASVGIRANVGTSSIASLRIVTRTTNWTAGVAESVWVEARDTFDNLAVGDTATVVMGSTDAATFNPPFGLLTAGRFLTLATVTLADTLRLTARAAAGSPASVSGAITVRPSTPSGTIPAIADRTELTADGRSTTTITFGPVRDAYGNGVASGTLLTVVAPAADTLLAADASPASGLQIATAVDDMARVVLRAPALAGPDTVRASSVSGDARGEVALTYVPPPSLTFVAGSLSPAIVAPGLTASFSVRVRNGGSGIVTIGQASLLAFGTDTIGVSAGAAAPLTLGSSQTGTLGFTPAAIPTSLTPGTYAPSLHLVGTDGTGEPFDFYLSLGGAQVHVAGVRVVAVGASPDPVSLGQAGLALTFRVENQAAMAATLDAVSLATSVGAFTVDGASPSLPAALPALGNATVTLSVTVPASGIPSGTTVSAFLSATATFGSFSVADSNSTPLQFEVISGAALAAQAPGTSPARYLRGRTFAPTARIANGGAASVTLDRIATRLVLVQGATRLETGLAANAVAAGGGTADLVFDSLSVPAGVPRGSYAATLILSGSESGQAFSDTIPLAPANVPVLDPPILSVNGTIDPDTVSAGQTRSLRVTITNAGDIPFALDASSRLSLGAPLSTLLAPAATDTIPAGGSLLVIFAAQPIGLSSAPGTAAAVFEARGSEDGRFRAQALDAGAFTAEPPASIAYVGGSAAPDTVRAGQTFALTVLVRNAGGSPFVVDPAATRAEITDGVESSIAIGSGPPFALGPGSQAALSFPSVGLPTSLASQPYPIRLYVSGTEWGQAESTAVVSPPGEILVVEPAVAVQLQGTDPGAPVQVATDGGAFAIWTLEMEPLIPPGGAVSAHVNSMALTVLTDGAPTANPGSVVARIEIRDAQDNVLAQSTPGAANPVLATLNPQLVLAGPPISLRLFVTLQSGATARSLALRVASAADIEVLDDLTQSAVPIRAPGGLPFAAITSASVTLFAKAHGYPNPFRAGREDVRLSYLLPGDASVRVAIYTLLGDLVREMSLPAGALGGVRGLNEVVWDGRNGKGEVVRPGVYVASIEGGGVSERIKVGVLR